MIYVMADGFLVDRMIEPALDENLYPTMIAVLLRGLEALASDQSPPEAPAAERPS